MNTEQLKKGTQVRVLDYSLFRDDKLTPLNTLLRTAVIVNGPYEYKSRYSNTIGTVVDVRFIHDGRVSVCHFVDLIEVVKLVEKQ